MIANRSIGASIFHRPDHCSTTIMQIRRSVLLTRTTCSDTTTSPGVMDGQRSRLFTNLRIGNFLRRLVSCRYQQTHHLLINILYILSPSSGLAQKHISNHRGKLYIAQMTNSDNKSFFNVSHRTSTEALYNLDLYL
jgi:hypothetical protein